MKLINHSIFYLNSSLNLVKQNRICDIKFSRHISNYIRTLNKGPTKPFYLKSLSRPPCIGSTSLLDLSKVKFVSTCSLRFQQNSQSKDGTKESIIDQSNNPESSPENEAEKLKDEQNKIRAIKFSFLSVIVMIAVGGIAILVVYGKPQFDTDGKEVKDQFTGMFLPKQYIMRAIDEAKGLNKMIQEPVREQLLPDPLKEPYIQPPYTLVFEMKDVLVHPEWTYQNGWRFKKRPGIDFLLQHCAPPLFEVVIYTNEQGFTAYPVIEQLDPNGFIWYKLFKESTRYVNGKHLKDLNCLNRDLKKVIMVDWDGQAVTSRRNQLCLKQWKGNMDDQALVDLAMMLRTIAESEVDDVREVLDYYRTFDDPVFAFRENHRVAQEQELERQKMAQEASVQKGFISGLSSSFLKRR